MSYIANYLLICLSPATVAKVQIVLLTMSSVHSGGRERDLGDTKLRAPYNGDTSKELVISEDWLFYGGNEISKLEEILYVKVDKIDNIAELKTVLEARKDKDYKIDIEDVRAKVTAVMRGNNYLGNRKRFEGANAKRNN